MKGYDESKWTVLLMQIFNVNTQYTWIIAAVLLTEVPLSEIPVKEIITLVATE